jgi:hypothetical protein
VPSEGRFVGYHGKLAFPADLGKLHIIKTHGVNAATEAELRKRATSVIISIRDPRDVMASLLLYHDYNDTSFNQALTGVERAATTCAHLVTDPRAYVLRYETRFTEDPATIDQIACVFRRELPRHERDRIFEESRRENVEKHINSIEQLSSARRHGDDLFDSDTQWHKLHSGRTGEVGKWRRTLSEGQIARIEARLFDWMRRFDYTPIRRPSLVARLMTLARPVA